MAFILDLANLIFTAVFTLEAVLKLIALQFKVRSSPSQLPTRTFLPLMRLLCRVPN